MKQSLLEAAALVALPVLIVFGAEVDDVFAWDVGQSAGRRKHLALHDGFNLTRDLHQEFFPDATRFGMLVSRFKQVLTLLTVDPFSLIDSKRPINN